MKPMMPTLSFQIPEGQDWIYETKFDGFRVFLQAEEGRLSLMSRNGKDLTIFFPEIKQFIEKHLPIWKPFFPLHLDGELAVLKSAFSSDFSLLKKSWKRKEKKTEDRPVRFLVFDVLLYKGQDLTKMPLKMRKKKLSSLFQSLRLPLHVCPEFEQLIQMVECYDQFSPLWELVRKHNGEGIIAKHLTSTYEQGKRTKNWLKIKNYKKALFIVSGMDQTNGYVHVSVHHKEKMMPVGVFSHGMSEEEKRALLNIIKKKGRKKNSLYSIDPAICIKLFFLSFQGETLREPFFDSFQLDHDWRECTYLQLKMAEANAEEVSITHLEKPLWPKDNWQKQDFLLYLLDASDYMLPFLQDRALTVIRYPHGIMGDSFFQKNCPDYAPDFIETKMIDGIHYIICNDKRSLLWLGNQLAIEFHLPFHKTGKNNPIEIVFDLDPPSKNEFHLAVFAALQLKSCLDRFDIISFPKLSGNKGIQVHIPIGSDDITYDETRIFTSFFAHYLEKQFPDKLTTERLKKKRADRLYIDYVQHGEGKTIIAPYSVRGNEHGIVAAPLYWSEVNDKLDMERFTMEYCMKRLKSIDCPMTNFFYINQEEKIREIIRHLS